jgi:predicted DNA-binding transcriptional regulator YafY
MAEAKFQRDPEDKSERLLSLTIALLKSGQRGLKKDEVYGAVRDYRNARDLAEANGKNLDALEKLFDRDKAILKESGVPLIAEIPADEGTNNTEYRYRIANDRFAWPKGLVFTARQLQLLELANQVWSRAALGTTTSRSMNRIRAIGPADGAVDLTSIAPKLRTHQPSFVPLTAAAESRNQVSFSYRKPGQSETELRTVQPWQLYQVVNQWILICFDLERGEVRNFLLKRITSKVSVHEEKFDAPSATDLAAAKASLESHIESQVATIRVPEGSPAWVHFDLTGTGYTDHSFHYMDLYLLAEELRELGPDVEVLEPVELKDAIRLGLEKVASDHA